VIIKEIFYAVKCDRCGCINEVEDIQFLSDEDIAESFAVDDNWLCNIKGKHYCPDCLTEDEETEEILIKPPFPPSVNRIKEFVEFTGNHPGIMERDNGFEIYFDTHCGFDLASKNWITSSYPEVKTNAIPNGKYNKIIITIPKQ